MIFNLRVLYSELVKRMVNIMVECRNIDYWKNEIFEYDRDVFRAFKFSENRIELSEEILNGMRNFVSQLHA